MSTINYEIYPLSGLHPDKTDYCVRAVHGGTVDAATIAREIQSSTALTDGDVKAALSALSTVVKRHLSEGKSVHLDGFGHFKVSLRCTKRMTDETVNGKHVQVSGVSFRPERAMLRDLQDCSMKRTKAILQSKEVSEGELLTMLKEYFATNAYLRRTQFQHMTHLTKWMACRKLSEFVSQGVLRKEGPRNAPLYLWVGE